MYRTGNKKLYVLQEEIEEIIEGLQLETSRTEQLIKRCYALCNYWKNDGKRGMAEFYHNNIRDFFLCEKIFFELENIYRNFKPEYMQNDRQLEEAIKNLLLRSAACILFLILATKYQNLFFTGHYIRWKREQRRILSCRS